MHLRLKFEMVLQGDDDGTAERTVSDYILENVFWIQGGRCHRNFGIPVDILRSAPLWGLRRKDFSEIWLSARFAFCCQPNRSGKTTEHHHTLRRRFVEGFQFDRPRFRTEYRSRRKIAVELLPAHLREVSDKSSSRNQCLLAT